MEVLKTAFLGSEHPVTLKNTPKLTIDQANRRFYEGTLLDLQTPATIEHVLPENPTAEWLEDFPNDLHERYVRSRLATAIWRI